MGDIKTYDAYLFDWDGTIASSHGFILEFVRGQLRSLGIELTDQQIVDKLFGRYGLGMAELGVSKEDIARLGSEVHEHLKENMPLAKLYPQVRTALETLHARHHKMALVTATYREVIDAAIVSHGLIGLFDCIVTGDEMIAQKPDPGGLLKALDMLGVPPERAVMIGDSKKDILAGNSAATETILFHPPEHGSQHDINDLKRCNPTYTIGSWQEFLDRLQ